MAKKKKHPVKRKTHHHRGRIGGVGHFNLMDTVMVGGGLLLGNMAGMMGMKYITMVPQKFVALGEMVLGIMHTNNPHPFMRGAAYGFAGAGASGFAHDTGILRGVDEVVAGMLNSTTLGNTDEDMVYEERIHGMPNDTTLGNTDDNVVNEPYAYSMPMGYM